jgi:peroxiredoxin
MIKKLSILAVAAIILVSCSTQVSNEFVITGDLDTTINAKLYLQKRADGPLITIDSTQITDGKFQMKGIIAYPEVYYLTIPTTKSSVPFFVEPSQIIINIKTKDINKTKITGSKNQAAYDSYLDRLDEFNAQIRENYKLYTTAMEEGDAVRARQYDSLVTALDEQRTLYSKDYVLENNRSFISPYIVFRNSYTYELEDLEKALNSFDTSLAHSVYTGFLNNFLATLKRVSVGQPYVPFAMADTSGNKISVSDFVGSNYLLVDFWASWCAPCREENPNLVALYNEYHDKGFNIFGVSFDSNRERWLKAIADDNLTWMHVSELNGWENSSGKLYGIRSIPSNVLLDTNGVIIAKNLRGDDLRSRLEELFPGPARVTK